MASVFNQALRMKTDREMAVQRHIREVLSVTLDEGGQFHPLSPENEQSPLHRRLNGSQSRWLNITRPKTEKRKQKTVHESLALLLHNQEVPDSNFDLETCYRE
jgi:hypothetical protein